MSFKTVTSSMKGLVGEGHAEFESQASQAEKMAVEAARRAQEAEKTGKGEERQKELSLELGTDGQVRAKYKIEVTFGPQRTTQGPNMVGIQLWESGKHFHGGGDELMYWCKDNREGHDEGCWAPIPGQNIKSGIAFCSNCQRTVNADLLTNMKIGRVSTRTLAKDLALLFRQLGTNADIFIKYHYSDPRYRAMAKERGEKVAKRLKGMHIYPLKNILKDTSAGADLAGRFFAFLTS
jgi:hypothetical protein